MLLASFGSGILVWTGKAEFLDWLYFISTLKLVITTVKYLPQVLLIYRLKSAEGLAMGAILLVGTDRCQADKAGPHGLRTVLRAAGRIVHLHRTRPCRNHCESCEIRPFLIIGNVRRRLSHPELLAVPRSKGEDRGGRGGFMKPPV